MALTLDNRTLVIASIFVYGWLTLLLALQMKGRRRYPGLRHWIVGTGLIAVGLYLVALQGTVGPSISIILANLSLVTGVAAICRGLHQFMGVRISNVEIAAYPLSVLGFFLYFTHIRYDTPARIVIISAIVAIIIFRWALAIGRPHYGSVQFLHRVGRLFFFLIGLFYLFRTINTLLSSNQISIFDPDLVTAASFMVSLIAGVTWTFLFIALIADRIDQERESLISKLQVTLSEVKTLEGLIPICANCKQVRNDDGYWQGVEQYISQHSQAHFTHGICPDCLRKKYPDLAEEVLAEIESSMEK